MPQTQADPAARRVLVAEDEPHIRRILSILLETAGYQVDALHDGDSAGAALEGPEPYDVILLDIMMPGPSGLDLLRMVRDLPHRQATPVLILTAKGQDADRDQAYELGAAGFVTKPFSPKKLLAQIDNLLPHD